MTLEKLSDLYSWYNKCTDGAWILKSCTSKKFYIRWTNVGSHVAYKNNGYLGQAYLSRINVYQECNNIKNLC